MTAATSLLQVASWRLSKAALQESHTLSGEPLNAWCRERGLFAHHLTGWKTAFCTEGKAAALLILQKKFRALWEDEVK